MGAVLRSATISRSDLERPVQSLRCKDALKHQSSPGDEHEHGESRYERRTDELPILWPRDVPGATRDSQPPFVLFGIGGNQCALVTRSHSPCRMEMNERDSRLEANASW